MTDTQIRTFLCVAKNGSFSKAATELHISAASLIQQIKLLETSLGFPLFIRTHHGVILTDSGKALLEPAEQSLRLLDAAVKEAKQIYTKQQNTIRIGVSFEEVPPFFNQIITLTKEQLPDVNLQFVGSQYQQFFSALLNGRIDCFFFPKLKNYPSESEFHYLYEDTWTLSVSKNNKLSHKKEILLSDIRNTTEYVEDIYKNTELHFLYDLADQNNLTFDNQIFSQTIPLSVELDNGVMPIPTRYCEPYTHLAHPIIKDLLKTKYGVYTKNVYTPTMQKFLKILNTCFEDTDPIV